MTLRVSVEVLVIGNLLVLGLMQFAAWQLATFGKMQIRVAAASLSMHVLHEAIRLLQKMTLMSSQIASEKAEGSGWYPRDSNLVASLASTATWPWRLFLLRRFASRVNCRLAGCRLK